MGNFLSPDSKFMRAMSRIGDLIILNVIFLVTCIPIFTIGAASTALYTVCFRMGTTREKGTFRAYFRAFRDNFKQATILWLILLLFGGSAAVNIYLFSRMPGAIGYLYILFYILFFFVLLITAYVFPLLSQFQNSTRETLKNAMVLCLAYLLRSIALVGLNVLPFVLLYKNFYLFLETAFIWAALYFSAAAYLGSILLKKVFAPYKEDDTETEEYL